MRILMAALVLCWTGQATAQETRDTFQVAELVVTAARLPTARSLTPASITVVTSEELRSSGARNVADVLRATTGAALAQSGSYGAFTSLFLRGGESDYVQVLIDGVQVNSPGEHFDFANLTLENIERIEIMRGPVSVLYGSDAVTGVVQLFTRHGLPRLRARASASGAHGSRVGPQSSGGFQSGALAADISGRAGDFSYSAGSTHFTTDGAYAFNNQHRNTGVNARLQFARTENSLLSASLRYSQNDFHYPTDGAGRLTDQNQFHEGEALSAGLEATHRFSAPLEVRVLLGLSRNDDTYDDAPDDAADTLGFYSFYSQERFVRRALDARANYSFSNRTVLTVGGELEAQSNRNSSLSESEFGPAETASAEQRHNRAAYTQLLTRWSLLSLQLGVRAEDNERFGNFATYRGGVAAQLNEQVRLRISAGTAFKEPRFFEQFATGFVRGNPDLQPEKSRSIEVGVDAAAGSFAFGATTFAQRFNNLVQYVAMPADANDPNYLNLAEAEAKGVEVEASFTASVLQARANYTLLDTEVVDPGTGDDPLFVAGEELIRRPRHSGSASVALRHRSAVVTLLGYLVGERADLDFSEFPSSRVALGPYARFDVNVELPLVRSARWPLHGVLKVENALDQDYEEVRNFPARGRVVFVGVRVGP